MAPHSQTLDRGIRVLEALATAERPLSIAELAAAIEVHRSIVYRILRTLEDHRLVSRRSDGLCQLGTGLATLARGVSRDLHTAALPELALVANELAMTCFVVVPDGEECVTLVSVEPRHSVGAVAQRPGTRHPISLGAPGLALLAGRPKQPDERPEVTQARLDGYAGTHDEVMEGLSAIAVPIGPAAAISVVYATRAVDVASIGQRLQSAARVIAAELP